MVASRLRPRRHLRRHQRAGPSSCRRPSTLTPPQSDGQGVYWGHDLSIGGITENADGQFTGTQNFIPPAEWGPVPASGTITADGGITFTYMSYLLLNGVNTARQETYTGAAEIQGSNVVMDGTWCTGEVTPTLEACAPQGDWLGSPAGLPPNPS
jgi:hypothetical protein